MFSLKVLSKTPCSSIMCWISPICLIVLSLFPISILTKLQSLLTKPPVYKPCIFFDTRQSDYCIYFVPLFILISYSSNNWLPLYSDLCPTLVQPLSDSSLWQPSQIIGHACIPYEWAQHISWSQVLFHYPLPIFDNSVLIWTPTLFWHHSGIGL